MRAGELSLARAHARAKTSAAPTAAELAATFAAFVAAVLMIAAIAHVLAPAGWRRLGTRPLPNRPSLIVGILANNLLITATPAYGAWLAARSRRRGRRGMPWLFIVLAGAVIVRAVAIIGLVGGLDPGWLAGAARWWLLEVAALAVSARTGWWLLRRVRANDPAGAAALRRAALLIVPLLSVGAVVEVLSA